MIEICDEVFIYDNSDEKPEVIFHISKNKQILCLEETLPKWCKNLLEELLDLGFLIAEK